MTEAAQAGSNREEAMAIVKKHALYIGGVALIPLPLVEFAVVPGAQLKLVHDLAKLYKIPFSENVVRSLLASLTGMGVTSLGNRVLSSLLKGVPVLGSATALTTAGLTGATTWAIGRVFIEHFETGGTLLTINAEKIKAHYEELLGAKPTISVVKDAPSYAGIRP